MTRVQLLALCKVASAPARWRHLAPSRARRIVLCSLHVGTRQVLERDGWVRWVESTTADPLQGVELTDQGWGARSAARALGADPYTRRRRKGEA